MYHINACIIKVKSALYASKIKYFERNIQNTRLITFD